MESCDRRWSHLNTSLLQGLRNKLVAESIINPTKEKEAEEKMNLILRHQSEFPAKLRASIREAAGEEVTGRLSTRKNPLIESISRPGISRFHRRFARKHNQNRVLDPEIFLHDVYEAVKVFFLGFLYRAFDADQHQHWLLGWHGLDRDVDTEDEAEVAIRCFPRILTQTSHLERTGLHRAFPIHMLLSNSKTVSFLPLFCQLGAELGHFQQEEKGGLVCSNSMSIVRQLLCNRIASTTEASRAQYWGRAPNTNKVDQESLAVLTLLRERGFVNREDVRGFELIVDLFDALSYRETVFVEKRLQLLINWNPDILKECDGKVGSNLLHAYCVWNGFHHRRRFCGERAENRIFEMIFEQGIHYFPLQVGFLFHNNIFQLACQRIGTKRVKEMAYVQLNKTLGETRNSRNDEQNDNRRNITLQTLVIAAATNKEISLDGIYVLIRFDPAIALVSQCTATRCNHDRGGKI